MVQIIIGKVLLIVWVHRLTVAGAGEDQNKEDDDAAPRHHVDNFVLFVRCRVEDLGSVIL